MPGVRGLRRAGRDQCNEADVSAGPDALQDQVADADGRLGAALLQGLAARIVEANLGENAKAEQRLRSVAGADEYAVACERSDRRIDALDQALQPLDQRHRAAGRFGARNQDAVAAIGKIKPCAAAGNERTGCGAEAAQPLQPDRAVRSQPARETRDLAPVQIRRSENLLRERCAMGCIEQPGADRIGPENPPAVDRPEPRRVGACGMHRQSRIADASQLEFRMIHRSGMTGWFGCYSASDSDIGGQNDDSLNRSLVSPAADGRSTASPSRRSPMAGITPI